MSSHYRNLLSLLFAVCLLAFNLHAQTITEINLTNVLNNQTVSLSGFTKEAGIVIIFYSNTCPFDLYYLERIRNLSQTFQGRMPFLLVNAHNDPEESVAAMKNFANTHSITIPYLADKSQTLMSALNARRSPEAFVLKNAAGKFSVVYRGAIDDNPQTAKDVIHPYLQQAIERLLAGQNPEVAETRPAGCSIRRN